MSPPLSPVLSRKLHVNADWKMHVHVAFLLVCWGICAVTSSSAVLVTTCKSELVTSLSNVVSTHWVIGQRKAGSRSQCAVSCLTDSRCVSFVYNDASSDCWTYAVVQTNATMTQTAVGYRYYSTCRGAGFYGAACRGSTQCRLLNAVCRSGACGCQDGYSFDPKKAACVHGCGAYGPEFEIIPGYFINANNVESLPGYDARACLERCRQATTYVCRSIDVRVSPDPACTTASISKLDVPASDWLPQSSLGWVTGHYQRHCSL